MIKLVALPTYMVWRVGGIILNYLFMHQIIVLSLAVQCIPRLHIYKVAPIKVPKPLSHIYLNFLNA